MLLKFIGPQVCNDSGSVDSIGDFWGGEKEVRAFELSIILGPGVLPNRGGEQVVKRDKKNWAVGSRV